MCYGYERAVSPAQWSIPSHASFFTDEYPTTHGVTQIYNQQSKEQVTLADILHSEGYLTVGFCNNPLPGVVDNGLDLRSLSTSGILRDDPKNLWQALP